MTKSLSNNYFFVSCPFNLESVLKKEIIPFVDPKSIQIFKNGLKFKGNFLEALSVILHSRTAEKVYLEKAKVYCSNLGQIVEQIQSLDWPSFFPLEESFCLSLSFDKEANQFFKNSLYVSQLIKDGICDRFQKSYQRRPSFDKKNYHQLFYIRVESVPQTKGLFCFTIYQDLCGRPLHQRSGFKFNPREFASIKENLAAGILLSFDEDLTEFPFVDCMCGQGTFLIEATLIKLGISPSYQRLKNYKEKNELAWPFLNALFLKEDLFLREEVKKMLSHVYEENKEKLRRSFEVKSFGIDIDATIVEQAQIHTRKALVGNSIILQQGNATFFRPPTKKPGIVFCNPPYGKRLGNEGHLLALYNHLGKNLKHEFKGWKAYILSGNPLLAKQIEMRPVFKKNFFNGPIDVHLLKFDLNSY